MLRRIRGIRTEQLLGITQRNWLPAGVDGCRADQGCAHESYSKTLVEASLVPPDGFVVTGNQLLRSPRVAGPFPP